MEFFEHGSVEIEKFDDTVIAKYIGPINLETFLNFSDSLLGIAKDFNGKRWAQINDLREWELSPPEVQEEAIRAEKNPEKLKFRCSDIVIIADKNIIQRQSEIQASDEVFLKQHVVNSTKEAIELLRSLGYNVNK